MRLIAFAQSPDDPACRFRIAQFIPLLERVGWAVSLRTNHPAHPWDSGSAISQRARVVSRRFRRLWDIRAARHYDAAWVSRDLLDSNAGYERRLLQTNPRLIYDFDDAVFLERKAAHFRWVCQHAAWVTAGNESLAHAAREFTSRVSVLPTVIDVDSYVVRDRAEVSGPVRVGWLGSNASIRETLFPYVPMLGRLQREIGFDFVVVTKPMPNLPQAGLRWSWTEWSPSVETRIANLLDIGIMPLVDNAFQRGKCGCKLLQYMAAGLPAIASPVGINRQILQTQDRGFLAGPEDQWRHALGSLSADPALRDAQGKEGRAFVTENYSLTKWFPIMLDILRKVAV